MDHIRYHDYVRDPGEPGWLRWTSSSIGDKKKRYRYMLSMTPLTGTPDTSYVGTLT